MDDASGLRELTFSVLSVILSAKILMMSGFEVHFDVA
jgi:hypothetical protein